MTVRSTYALDQETVETLDRLAKQWNVSKSEALRRAIHTAAEYERPHDRLELLTALQESANLSPQSARKWASEVRRERRAASSRRMRA